jgi:hypothetical protein
VKAKKLVLFAAVFVLLLSFAAKAKLALDPSEFGVGARALGMGKVFVAIPGEPDSVFLNPAALSEVPNWGVTSMYTQLLGEVNYILLGVVRPLGKDTIGVGMLSATVGGIQSATRDPVTGRLSLEAGTTTYYNNIYYISYGREILEKLSAGIDLKLFNQGFTGGDTGTGYDADLGLIYHLRDDLKLGFLQRNFVPASLGAKIKWSDGKEDGILTSSRLGLSYSYKPAALKLNADYEFFPTQSDKSSLLKLGAEWWLTPTFALRVGSDQDPSETNMTAGLSILTRGFKFDYAYHEYGSLSQNTAHIFSLSYGVFGEEEEAVVEEDPVEIVAPEDKTIVFEDRVVVEGYVLPRVERLWVNEKERTLVDGNFRFAYSLLPGKNTLRFIPYDSKGDQLEGKTLRILRLPAFKDVPKDYWVRKPISVMALLGIIGGYPDGTFRPEGNITRAEMCTVLMKIKGTKDVGRATGFRDVPARHWAARYIAQAVAEGIVKGYPDETFKPNGLITRAEGVTIVARFAGLPEPKLLEAPYPDVPGRHWAARYIMSAKEAGLLQYLGKRFDLNKKLTRAEAVEILSKTELLAPRIKEVLDFKEGG